MKSANCLAMAFLLMFTLASSASPSINNSSTIESSKTSKKTHPWKFLVFVGNDLRFEKTEQQSTEAKSMFELGIGVRKGIWLSTLDFAQRSESSSFGSTSMTRKFEQILFGLSAVNRINLYFAPYLGGGLGVYRDSVENKIEGSTSNSQSKWDPLAHVDLGCRFFPDSKFWLSLEGKMLMGSRLDPNPMMGGLLRVGGEF